MKKYILCGIALATGCMAVNAQEYVERTKAFDNWSIGIDAGVTTPLHGYGFFKSMRPLVGLHIQKQISPMFGIGAEGQFGINTSGFGTYGDNFIKSNNVFDDSYVGAYGTLNLMELFGGFQCEPRKFTIDAVLGAGWGHDFYPESQGGDYNFFATKAGLNFNYNVCPNFTISLKPSVIWDMSDAGVRHTSAAYNANHARFNIQAGFTYNFGPGFKCVVLPPDYSAQVAALNDQVNALRGQAADAAAALAAATAQNADLAAALAACQAQPTTVVNPVTNNLQSVRYVFYKNASSVITPDQMPNVEMIAQYLKNHPDAKADIKGYASATGAEEFNIKLANARAESVKNALIKKYGIKADRITAKGEGIGHMFSEESWNRVAICILDK